MGHYTNKIIFTIFILLTPAGFALENQSPLQDRTNYFPEASRGSLAYELTRLSEQGLSTVVYTTEKDLSRSEIERDVAEIFVQKQRQPFLALVYQKNNEVRLETNMASSIYLQMAPFLQVKKLNVPQVQSGEALLKYLEELKAQVTRTQNERRILPKDDGGGGAVRFDWISFVAGALLALIVTFTWLRLSRGSVGTS